MTRALSESKARDVEAGLTRAHKLIHSAYDGHRLTAKTLGELAKNLREVAGALSALAASPFLSIDPTPPPLKDREKEPDLRWR